MRSTLSDRHAYCPLTGDQESEPGVGQTERKAGKDEDLHTLETPARRGQSRGTQTRQI